MNERINADVKNRIVAKANSVIDEYGLIQIAAYTPSNMVDSMLGNGMVWEMLNDLTSKHGTHIGIYDTLDTFRIIVTSKPVEMTNRTLQKVQLALCIYSGIDVLINSAFETGPIELFYSILYNVDLIEMDDIPNEYRQYVRQRNITMNDFDTVLPNYAQVRWFYKDEGDVQESTLFDSILPYIAVGLSFVSLVGSISTYITGDLDTFRYMSILMFLSMCLYKLSK